MRWITSHRHRHRRRRRSFFFAVEKCVKWTNISIYTMPKRKKTQIIRTCTSSDSSLVLYQPVSQSASHTRSTATVRPSIQHVNMWANKNLYICISPYECGLSVSVSRGIIKNGKSKSRWLLCCSATQPLGALIKFNGFYYKRNVAFFRAFVHGSVVVLVSMLGSKVFEWTIWFFFLHFFWLSNGAQTGD